MPQAAASGHGGDIGDLRADPDGAEPAGCRPDHDRGSRAEEDRRRLRADGQPAARLSTGGARRPGLPISEAGSPNRHKGPLYWVMEKRIYPEPIESVVSPEPFGRKSFTDAAE